MADGTEASEGTRTGAAPAPDLAPDLTAVSAERLGRDGQRLTAQRLELVELLAEAGAPLSIPEILERRPHLAQSSVYRNLTALERAGVVQRLLAGDEWGRYELAEDLTEHHHHLICSTCGRVADITLPHDVEEALDRAVAVVATERGFRIDAHRFDLLGQCGRCLTAAPATGTG